MPGIRYIVRERICYLESTVRIHSNHDSWRYGVYSAVGSNEVCSKPPYSEPVLIDMYSSTFNRSEQSNTLLRETTVLRVAKENMIMWIFQVGVMLPMGRCFLLQCHFSYHSSFNITWPRASNWEEVRDNMDFWIFFDEHLLRNGTSFMTDQAETQKTFPPLSRNSKQKK